jgi:hypothetical protein
MSKRATGSVQAARTAATWPAKSRAGAAGRASPTGPASAATCPAMPSGCSIFSQNTPPGYWSRAAWAYSATSCVLPTPPGPTTATPAPPFSHSAIRASSASRPVNSGLGG